MAYSVYNHYTEGNQKFGYYDEDWYDEDGQYSHREEGPANIRWRDDRIMSKNWIFQDKMHREDGPAYMSFDDQEIEGFVFGWFQDDVPHRLDGPSFIHLNSGTFKVEKLIWAISGIVYKTKEEYIAVLELGKRIRTNRDLAILNVTHPSKYIKDICKGVLNEF